MPRLTFKAAFAEATRRFGQKARIEFDKHALTKEQKAPLSARLKIVRAELNAMHDGKNKPSEPFVKGALSPAWKAWCEKRHALNVEERELQGQVLSDRCKVGSVSTLAGFAAFHVRAWGDTWEECFAKLDAEKAEHERKEQIRRTRLANLAKAREEKERKRQAVVNAERFGVAP